MMKAPTHKEIADVLQEVDQDIANFVKNNPQYCWAELLLVIQKQFPVSVVSRSLIVLEKFGFGAFIRHAWCPATDELTMKFDKLDKTGIVKIREGYLGNLYVMRFVWKKTRNAWMKKFGLLNVLDEAFVRMICLWLEMNKDSEV
jgi:hypothetical protein